MKKTKQKNIFSTARITRLIFTSWLISLGITFLLTSILQALVPAYTEMHFVIIILIFYAISTLIGSLIFYFFTKRTNAVIAEINSSIHKLSTGDFSAKIDFPPINDDVDQVVNNYNNMVQELNSLAILNNDFISNFSHEFKTPIVSVKGYAELLYESPNLTLEQKQYAKIILDESNRLANLSNSALTLSKLDYAQVVNGKTKFYLDEEIAQCILLFDNQLNQKNLTLECDIDSFVIFAHKNLTREIWINLISNAVKYTPENGIITITAKEHGEYAFVTITDSGGGITPEIADKIFSKNYRGENAISTEGHGLGLSITKRIVELHGGTLHAETTQKKVSQIVVKLPTNNKSAY